MRVLGIETSCDETGVAVYDSDAGLRAHLLHSQAALHAEYGGVVPELASRDHVRKLIPLLDAVLAAAGVRLGVTYPRPVVDAKASREAALIAFSALKAVK